MSSPETQVAPPALATRSRIIGIDIVRFLAIVGMMAAHLLGLVKPAAGTIERLLDAAVGVTVSSTAATTFAVLGGVSLVLLSRSMRDRSPGRMLLSITLRGLLITLIGALLEQLAGPISVVLTAYGISLIIAAPALLLPARVVGGIAAALWLVGGAFNAYVRGSLTASVDPMHIPDLGEQTLVFVRDLLLTGHYPAITWVAYMLVGIVIARLLLSAPTVDSLRRLCVRLAVWGGVIYAALTVLGRLAALRPGWFGIPPTFSDVVLRSDRGAPVGTDLWMLLIPAPHSGTVTDMLRTVAGACLLIGLLVLLCDVRRWRGGFALSAVRAAGAAPLTIYSTHVVATALLYKAVAAAYLNPPVVLPWFADGLINLGMQLVGILIIGAVLAWLGRRGPLETLLGWASLSRR